MWFYKQWQRLMKILPQPLWGPSGSQVCDIFPAWRESSSTCTSWWRAWHQQYQEHNRRSLHRPLAQTHSLSSVSGDLPLTCRETARILSAMLILHCRGETAVKSLVWDDCKQMHIHFLPVSYEVRVVIRERYFLHSFTVHFFTDFINCSLQKERTDTARIVLGGIWDMQINQLAPFNMYIKTEDNPEHATPKLNVHEEILEIHCLRLPIHSGHIFADIQSSCG